MYVQFKSFSFPQVVLVIDVVQVNTFSVAEENTSMVCN